MNAQELIALHDETTSVRNKWVLCVRQAYEKLELAVVGRNRDLNEGLECGGWRVQEGHLTLAVGEKVHTWCKADNAAEFLGAIQGFGARLLERAEDRARKLLEHEQYFLEMAEKALASL